MSVRSFRPVAAVATVAAAALSCYLVSLRVAAERAGLEEIETRIVLAQRDIRTLQTEIGTRGRLEQLERWNVKVLALGAPKAEQFVDGGYQLARLARPSDPIALSAPVVLASARRPVAAPPTTADDGDVPPRATPRATRDSGGPASLMHTAGYTLSVTPPMPAKPTAKAGPTAEKPLRKTADTISKTTKPAKIATAVKRPVLPVKVSDAKMLRPGQGDKNDTSGTTASREKATH